MVKDFPLVLNVWDGSWDSSVSQLLASSTFFKSFSGFRFGCPESSTLVSLGGGHDLRMLVWMVEGSSSFVNVVYSFLLKGQRLMVLGVWFCGKCDSSLGLLICKSLKK